MIDVRPFGQLGQFRNAWLNARHHFSFGGYDDPKRMGVGDLRVWNDDEIAPGKGFDPHPHRDMEIVTYVREGAITHRDDLGNSGRTEAGDVQVMHAGAGIVHGEHNEEAIPTRIFQIWIMPNAKGVAPGWGSREFPKQADGGLIALADGRASATGEALPLHADAAVFAAKLSAGRTVHHRMAAGRAAYLVAAAGAIEVNGIAAATRDGVAISGETDVAIKATEDAEIVLVDVEE